MRLENTFDVPAPPESAWALLMDVPRVVPCMPGAELAETVDESHWKAKLEVRLGPIALTYAADVERTEVDEAARRIVLAANARELRGRGGAKATIESSLETTSGGTSVSVVTEITLSGTAAQFGGPVVKDVAAQLTREFAACLRQQLVVEPRASARGPGEPAPADSAVPRTKPISGFSLLVRALLSRLKQRR